MFSKFWNVSQFQKLSQIKREASYWVPPPVMLPTSPKWFAILVIEYSQILILFQSLFLKQHRFCPTRTNAIILFRTWNGTLSHVLLLALVEELVPFETFVALKEIIECDSCT
jgi:hypothetical protein